MNQTFMKEKKIVPLVLSMALPMVLSMAVNALYNIVDSYFVAKVSENAMTALALVYPAQNMVTSIAVGFGIGINANIAYYLGAGNHQKANRAATQGVALSLLHGVLLMLLCLVGMPAFLDLFSSDKETVFLALQYSNRVFLFSVVNMLQISMEKIFQSVGRMKVSMISMAAGFIVNIVLDPLMIFGIGIFPEMGMAGAAYATGIGQTVALLVYVVINKFRPLPVKMNRKSLVYDKELVGRMYAVGIPASLNMALPSLLISALNGILAGFSEKYVLVLGIYYKLQTFIYLTANGVIQGIRPLVGYNYGAGEHDRVRKISRLSLQINLGVMLVGTILCWMIPEQLMGLFTTHETTLRLGVEALHLISLGFIASAVSVTLSGVLEGLSKGMASLYISLLRYVVLIIPAAFLFSRFAGAAGVWFAFIFTELLTAGFSWYIYKKILKP